MATAEEERKERIKRNHAMLRNVTNAAEDLASSVPTSSQPDPEAVRKEELKQRLAFEAQQHGLRKSSRLASSAARTRITKSLHSGEPPEFAQDPPAALITYARRERALGYVR